MIDKITKIFYKTFPEFKIRETKQAGIHIEAPISVTDSLRLISLKEKSLYLDIATGQLLRQKVLPITESLPLINFDLSKGDLLKNQDNEVLEQVYNLIK